MKFYTLDWCRSRMPDTEIDRIYDSYQSYINSIYEELPHNLRNLITNVNLHDGIIKNVIISPSQNKLSMYGIFGDLQTGYTHLHLEYTLLNNFSIGDCSHIFMDEEIEILSDEIEFIRPDSYKHRILFNSGKEIEICFNKIELQMSPAAPSDYKKCVCSYQNKD